jgi:hypothetical protein
MDIVVNGSEPNLVTHNAILPKEKGVSRSYPAIIVFNILILYLQENQAISGDSMLFKTASLQIGSASGVTLRLVVIFL